MFSFFTLTLIPSLLSIASSVLSIVSPYLKAIGDFSVWYLHELWEGVKAVYKQPSLLVLLFTVGLVTGSYISLASSCEDTSKQEVKQVQPVKDTEKPKDPFGIW